MATSGETLAWLGELWRHRAAEPFGAVVLIDPPDGRPSVERSLVSSFAEACVEAAAAEGLPWRLVAQLREQFAVNMSIRQLYINDRLTVSGIATVLEEKTP
ncbi:hypothetical protein OG333_19435 [Streptomyces anulatus]|uniref:hypothetical protein n=1 Tax=Streptomyces anulatus TaxID=1892 RepID=UPI0033E2371B|nr:hypothetical protein OG333_19435 [Streptomyces anulatus]